MTPSNFAGTKQHFNDPHPYQQVICGNRQHTATQIKENAMMLCLLSVFHSTKGPSTHNYHSYIKYTNDDQINV